jgi:hypothetical protein
MCACAFKSEREKSFKSEREKSSKGLGRTKREREGERGGEGAGGVGGGGERERAILEKILIGKCGRAVCMRAHTILVYPPSFRSLALLARSLFAL